MSNLAPPLLLARPGLVWAAGIAAALGLLATIGVAFRSSLRTRIWAKMSSAERRDLLALVAATAALTLLPDHPLDRFGLLNPFMFGRLAVVVMALSGAGYFAQRFMGARFGLLVSGLAAGFISSTAAVVAMGARSREQPALAAAGAAGAIASLLGSLAYLTVILAAVSPALIRDLAAPLGLSALLLSLCAGWMTRGAEGTRSEATVPGGRPFRLTTVGLFVVLVGGFSVASEVLILWLGAPAMLVGAGIMGLADAHAAAVSLANLAADGKLSASLASLGVAVTLTANMVIKIPAALLTGAPGYTRRVAIGVAALLGGLWAGWAITQALPVLRGG